MAHDSMYWVPSDEDLNDYEYSECPRCGASDPKHCTCANDAAEVLELMQDAKDKERRNWPAGATEHTTGSKADDWNDRGQRE